MSKGDYLKELWPVIRLHLLDKIEIGEVRIQGHAEKQGDLRKISQDSAFKIVMDNPIQEMFKEFEYPYGDNPFQNVDPVFTIAGKVTDGFTVAVPFAVKMNRSQGKMSLSFYPVTLIHTNRGRHAKK